MRLVDKDKNGHLYAAVLSLMPERKVQIYKSTDEGQRWSLIMEKEIPDDA